MLAQIGMAFWLILAGMVSLIVGLTGVVFGWHHEDERKPPEAAVPDSILRVSELSNLHDEPTLRAMYSSPRLRGLDNDRLDPQDQTRRLSSDRPPLGQTLHP
jgi:hypothetical protein